MDLKSKKHKQINTCKHSTAIRRKTRISMASYGVVPFTLEVHTCVRIKYQVTGKLWC